MNVSFPTACCGPELRWLGAIVLALSCRVLAAADEPPAAAQIEFFESRIRPVLSEHCYECHNSAGDAQGSLALDHRAGILKGGEQGPLVVPGNPRESLLLKVLRHEIDGLEMPQGRPQLDRAIIADFERWIAIGAPDPRDQPPTAEELARSTSWEAVFARRKKWWSFQPIILPAVPVPRDPDWSRDPIDCFIRSALERQDLLPGPPADAPTLVRRLYFTLIGLPPAPEEIEYWVRQLAHNSAPARQAALERLVDSLLENPRFGERWARHWMDWIRYAETHGSEGDPAIVGAWHYRDYLVRALNADVPCDQLLREHVAGDLLEQPRINPALGINESLIGPAHWRMVFHGFAPTDALEEKVRFTDDQINVFSKAFLGLTVACARCHDHKFDPISQRDYYALFGILGSCRPGRAVIDLPEIQHRHRNELLTLKSQIREALSAAWLAAVPRMIDQWFDGAGDEKPADKPQSLLFPWRALRAAMARGDSCEAAWQVLAAAWRHDRLRRVETASPPGGKRWDLTQQEDYQHWDRHGIGLPVHASPAGEFAVALTGDRLLTGIYPAGIYSHLLTDKDPARLTSQTLRLDGDYDLYLYMAGAGNSAARYVVQNYPRNGTVYPVTKLTPDWRWQKYDLSYWNGDEVHIELATAADAPLLATEDARSWFGIQAAVLAKKGSASPPADLHAPLDPVYLAAELSPPGNLAELKALYAQVLRSALQAWRDGTATSAQANFLSAALEQNLLPNSAVALPDVQPLFAEYRRLEAEIPVPTRVPGLDETLARNQTLFERGDHHRPGGEVPRRFLEVIDATPYRTARSGRRELAEDLLRDDNPLTRRVLVNRCWHHLFGEGIVRTPDNFGHLGQRPTHPELLDWLAIRFSEQGWSLKQLIRSIVLTRTWQLASHPGERARQIDPDNRFLSHAHLRRLEAEAIRDALLAVSGRLSSDMSGPPAEEDSLRRSVYLPVRRNALDPFLRVFDLPEPFSTTGRRDVTNVPAQSLTLMNDPRLLADAHAWSQQILAAQNLNDDARIERMFLAAFARRPAEWEVQNIQAYLGASRRQNEEFMQQRQQLQQELAHHRQAAKVLLEPVRAALLKSVPAGNSERESAAPAPISRWEFDTDLQDALGDAHGEARNGAHLDQHALVVGQNGYVITAPLSRPLLEKTLEAWVQLDSLTQRGGGVMSVQTSNGEVFDALVFGEKDPQQWLAGSDYFRRTRSFQAPPETEAHDRVVHLAIAYHADGRIAGYRDGVPYGRSYQTASPIPFPAGEAVIGFGIRHLPAGGNKMLSGRILRAQLYDTALSAEEVRASFESVPRAVTQAQVLAALTPQQRQQWNLHQQQISDLETRLEQFSSLPEVPGEAATWTELARALFLFKEFIYVK